MDSYESAILSQIVKSLRWSCCCRRGPEGTVYDVPKRDIVNCPRQAAIVVERIACSDLRPLRAVQVSHAVGEVIGQFLVLAEQRKQRAAIDLLKPRHAILQSIADL